ncbi:hypothetical protein [Planomonospora sp. ID82291]|uniref:hypothetical protein n=1 Tax=Planomonospora sp. ID82291 TaxID=2738136 RepID=UPI0018C40748|nr:hypothetical protein [Planomonospora sp. ID82291]MBG0814203.1 hypothetical protein [Planomonospora sp. ID82291]
MGLTFVGILAFVALDVLIGLLAISTESSVGIGVAAVILALGTFGTGVALVRRREAWSKGLGIGLMLGWALVSIFSAGFCTGLNPGLYP